LVEQALRPYHSGTDRNIEIRGQDVLLRPDAALTLSLILHELTTNAVKYGALTQPNGRVRVGWALGQAASGQRLRLRWCESGGPPIQRPAKLGFGLYLIERSVAHEFDGGASFDFAQDGLTCEIDVPWTNTIGAIWPGTQVHVTWH
jgi:two-component sensor histidine kinase